MSMQIPRLELQPPPRYGGLRELERILSTVLPTVIPQLAEILGRRSPRLTRKDGATFKNKTRKLLRNSKPYALALTALHPGPDQGKAFYALHEGLVKENLRASGLRISDDQDAFEWLLRHAERQVESPKGLANLPAYSSAKKAVYEFVLFVCQQVNGAEIDRKLKEWYASKSCKKSMQSRVIWPTLLRKWRHSAPQRLTLKLVAQLSEEYWTGASIFEERLRLLIWLDEISRGVAVPWPDQERRTLYNLLEAAKVSSKLSWLPPLIDRHVRNALAHGQPGINVDNNECRFHDTTHTVTWKVEEFFENTKRLTFTTRALMELEILIDAVQLQTVVRWLWQVAQPQNP